MKKPKISQGKVLIASPLLRDKTFGKTVVYISEHNTNTTVGFVLNRPLRLCLSHFFPFIKPDFKLWWGGPVDTDLLFFIHNIPQLLPESVHIKGDIYWGGSFDILKDLLKKGLVNSSNVRFFLGYTGWQADQIDQEIDQHTWLVERYLASPICHTRESMWIECLCGDCSDRILWDKAPEDLALN